MRSPHKFALLVVVPWLVLLPNPSCAMTNGFTTVVEAGKVNCFFDNVDPNKTLEIEYQVRCHFSCLCKLSTEELFAYYIKIFIRNSQS